jgi:CRP-like cAMP-binding protein
VVAESTVRLLRLDRHDLYEVIEEHPAIAVAICQTLSRRLREFLDNRLEGNGAPRSGKGS